MDRLPPFDKIGVTPVPDFVNADPTNGVPGSIVNGAIFNALQREVVNAILASKQTPSSTDFTQLAQAIALIAASSGVAQAKSIFNVRQFQTNTRVSASGSVANQPTIVWSGITYTKKSPTSLVLCSGSFQTRINFNPLSPAAGQYGASQIALALGSQSKTIGIANSYPGFSYFNSPAPVFTGLGIGDQAVSVGLQRPDANAWTNVFNPVSSDESHFPTPNTATLIFAEVEP